MVCGRGTWDGGHEAGNRATHAGYSRRPHKGRSVCQDGVGQEEGQRIRPSSQASLEAAASSATSDDSQPPLGTLKRGLNE